MYAKCACVNVNINSEYIAGLKYASVCHILTNREHTAVVSKYLVQKYYRKDMKVPSIAN